MLPMPDMGYLAWAMAVSPWLRPSWPQSTEWSLASLATVTPACCSAVSAVGGAKKM